MRRVLGYSYVGDTNYPINSVGSFLISTADSTPTGTPTFAGGDRAGINLGLDKEFNVSVPVGTRVVSSSDIGRILVLKSDTNPQSNSGCFLITNFESISNSYVVDYRSGTYIGGATSIASSSNNAALPTSTINVSSTTGFPSSGTIKVVSTAGVQTITYTSINSTQFLGCSGGTGTIKTGYAVNSQLSLPQSTIISTSTTGFPAATTSSPQTFFLWSSAGRQTITYTGISGNNFTGCTGGTGTIVGGVASAIGTGASVIATTTNTTIAAGSNGLSLPQTTINVASTTTGTTTITASSNNVSLPTGTINVSSTTSFPTNGRIYVTTASGPQLVTYTGTTATTFTGCTGGTGRMSTGNAVVAGFSPTGGIIYVTTSTGVQQVTYTGTTSTTFTGCTGGTGVMSTSNLVYYSPNVPPIEAADSMNWYLYESDSLCVPQSPITFLSSPTFTITNETGTTGSVYTVTVSGSHGLTTGNYVTISGVVGANNSSNGTWVVTVTGSNTFTLNGSSWGASTTYTSGGTVTIPYVNLPATLYGDPSSIPFSNGKLYVLTTNLSWQQVTYSGTGTYGGKLGFTGISGAGFVDYGYVIFENTNNSNTTSQYRGNGTSTAPRIILQSPHPLGWQIRVCHETIDDSGSVNFLSQSSECAMISTIPGFEGDSSGDFPATGKHLHTALFFNSNDNKFQGGIPGFGDNQNFPTSFNSMVYRITIVGDTDGYGVSMFARRPGNASNPRSYFVTYGMCDSEATPLPSNDEARLFVIGSGYSGTGGGYLNDMSWYPGNLSSGGLYAQGITRSVNHGTYSIPVSVCASLLAYAAGNSALGSPIFDGSAGDTPWFGGVELFPVDLISGSFFTWNNNNYSNYGFPISQGRFLGTIPHIREGRANYAEYSTSADLVAQHMRRGLWMLWNGPPVVT